VFRCIGTAEEDVAEQPRTQSPVRAYRPKDRVGDAWSDDLRAVGVAPVQHQPLDPFGKRRGKCDGGATPRRAAEQRHSLQAEFVKQRAQRRDFPVEAQIRVMDGAIRHTDAEVVVADQRVSLCDAFPESPEARVLPVELEVAHPPRRGNQRWTVPTYLVRQAPRAKGKELDLRLLQHRHEPTAAA
jgi:hypothetical protein